MKKIILISLSCFLVQLSFGQDILNSFKEETDDPERMNNVYHKEHHNTRENVALEPIREADVMWSRRIWREIDLRQKINHPLYYPQETGSIKTIDRDNLFKALYNAATGNGEISIRAFNAEVDDEFQNEMTPTELMTIILGTEYKVYHKNRWGEDSLKDGNKILMKIERRNGLHQADIKTWQVREQWFFDKQRSVMDVRIIGLCPVAAARDENGSLTGGDRPICWFYFPECRKVLKNSLAFNLVKNAAENKTFEDIFMKRMFSSTIIKEENVYDREISDYMVGLDALLEAEKIKTEIFNIEHDLWEY